VDLDVLALWYPRPLRQASPGRGVVDDIHQVSSKLAAAGVAGDLVDGDVG